MSQYRVPDPDELMECPYDKVHMVRAKRFQYHLMKCRKNYTGKDFVTCPFNAKHEMPKPELRHHLANCPDKAYMDPDREFSNRKDGDVFKGCTDTPVYEQLDIPMTEDWDSEVTGVTYGPLHDNSYYSRVQFKTVDRTVLGKEQRAIVRDERLTAAQKINELNQYRNADMDEDIRLPKTLSMAARPAKPQVQPREQPDSSVFAYSVAGRGRGRGIAQMSNGTSEPSTNGMPGGRGMGVWGVGRGQMPGSNVGAAGPMPGRGGVGRGIMGSGRGVAPPPGFCVPNINHQQEMANGFH